MRNDGGAHLTGLGRALQANRLAQLAELLLVFAIPIAGMILLLPLAGGDPIKGQTVVWCANVGMILLVWLGLRVRHQGWSHFGLDFGIPGPRAVLRAAVRSILVFLFAVAAFVLGAIVVANITGVPEGADLGAYAPLRGNVGLLVVALIAVWISASFGEEVVYRGFLMNRIAEMGSSGKWAWRTAVVVSALAFGLAHYTWGLIGIVETTCMGLALAVSYLRVGKNLWVNVLAHGYMDTILMVQMYMGAGQSAT